jgi:PEP-CTERM motif
MQHLIRAMSFVVVLLLITTPAWAVLLAGSGPGASAPIIVPFDSDNMQWVLTEQITFDPGAPGMEKHFGSPQSSTGGPILLDAFQPFPIPVWENFPLIGGLPISDWHEELLTPGWEWLIPDPGGLITRNGVPWPSQINPNSDPVTLWVDFPPIVPDPFGGVVLDVHKEMLWVGTPGNSIWGDGVDDSGTTVDESFIRVLEYPTPEPASVVLMGFGALALLRKR